MKEDTKKISHEELTEYVRNIGKPTLEFMNTLMRTNIIDNKEAINLTLDDVIAITIGCLATMSASSLKWLHTSISELSKSPVDMNLFRDNLIKNIDLQIDAQIGVVLH